MDVALCRGVLYSALALGFRPPTAETVERLTQPDAVAALAAAAQRLDEEPGAEALAPSVAALAQPAMTLERLQAEHRYLFGHTARGEVPAYETEYGNEALFQQPQELSDLAGFMQAFGLRLRPDAHERIDHVSCECEFLSFLAWKEAYAIEHGDAEMQSVTVRATPLFLRDHVCRFGPAFARRLMRTDGSGFYAALGRLFAAIIHADARRLGIPLGSEGLGLRPDPATCTVPMGCAEDGGALCPATPSAS